MLTTGPTPTKCQVSLATPPAIKSDGGTVAVTVTTQPECAWTVSTDAGWISGLSPASGQGTGQVEFQAAPNPAPSARQGEIVVNDNRVVVSQEAAPCQFDINPMSGSFGSGGGSGTIEVTGRNGCVWTASTADTWIAITAGATGNGNSTVRFSVEPNNASPRSGQISVAGHAFVINQSEITAPPPAPPVPPPASCTYDINPTSHNAPVQGGIAPPVTVTTGVGCPWNATTTASWISITSGANGTGPGSVGFAVMANNSGPRSATIAIAGEDFTVSQPGVANGCNYVINPTSQSMTAGGGAGSPIGVGAGAGCPWTAVSNVPWLTITSGANGSGNGAVTFTAAANSGANRTGTLTIAGQTFTVTQAGVSAPSCTFVINPTSQSIAAAGGAGSPIGVGTASGCSWTAVSNVPWITITSAASGSGDGAVTFTVAANTGAVRTGTITIAGQTFTLQQAGVSAPSCTYVINPTSVATTALGGAEALGVGTASGCPWTATSNAPWITITSGASGSGNGAVSFLVAPNVTLAPRSGTITVAGQTFTVTQAGI